MPKLRPEAPCSSGCGNHTSQPLFEHILEQLIGCQGCVNAWRELGSVWPGSTRTVFGKDLNFSHTFRAPYGYGYAANPFVSGGSRLTGSSQFICYFLLLFVYSTSGIGHGPLPTELSAPSLPLSFPRNGDRYCCSMGFRKEFISHNLSLFNLQSSET